MHYRFCQIFFIPFFMVLHFIFGNQVSAGEAEEKAFFDKKAYYDIYINSGERMSTVIENVKIVRFEEIKGREFLVIESSSFKLKDESGYILFDSILAILPRDYFRVRSVPSPKGKVIYSQ